MVRARRHNRTSEDFQSNTGERLVIGRNASREVLTNCPERVLEVLISAAFERGAERASAILEMIRRASLEYKLVDQETLSKLAGSDSHQGIALRVRAPAPVTLKELLEAAQASAHSLVLFLDGVVDPQNLGSILRAAECFNVSAVVWSRNRSPGVTPAVSKASVGASELVTCIEVGNLAEALRTTKEFGYWVVAADGEKQAVRLEDFKFPSHVALVAGSEGDGLRALTLERSDFRVRIPMLGSIDSLNVGQAVAVMLYAYRAQNHGGNEADERP